MTYQRIGDIYMNHSETLIEIEDLMLYICSGKCYWKEAQSALEDYRKEATDIYDPELEYSPLLQGYFDLMSTSRSLDMNRITTHTESYFIQEQSS
jgi:hypothetical protein